MSLNIKLKPCPFCGGEAVYTDHFYEDTKTGHCVYCIDCGAGTAIVTGSSTPEYLKKHVFDLWNRRTEHAEIQSM